MTENINELWGTVKDDFNEIHAHFTRLRRNPYQQGTFEFAIWAEWRRCDYSGVDDYTLGSMIAFANPFVYRYSYDNRNFDTYYIGKIGRVLKVIKQILEISGTDVFL